jgi:hypothetical protein
MRSEQTPKKLYCVRLHPDDRPHEIIALLADSENDAKKLARTKSGLEMAHAVVREVPDDDAVIVTFS